MKLDEIDIDKINWDMTPQRAMRSIQFSSKEELERYIQEIKDQACIYFYIDVWNCTPRLAVMELFENGNARSETIEDHPLSAYELIQAVEEQGAINISGHYPLNKHTSVILQRTLRHKL